LMITNIAPNSQNIMLNKRSLWTNKELPVLLSIIMAHVTDRNAKPNPTVIKTHGNQTKLKAMIVQKAK
jgi:hypothetical protein